MMSGDVERGAYEALPDDIEVRFSTVPCMLAQDSEGVDVTLRRSTDGHISRERFSLVVGADGLRSSVRAMAFAPHDNEALHSLGCMIAAFELPGDLPGIRQGEGAVLVEPGRPFWVFPFADHPSTVVFSPTGPATSRPSSPDRRPTGFGRSTARSRLARS